MRYAILLSALSIFQINYTMAEIESKNFVIKKEVNDFSYFDQQDEAQAEANSQCAPNKAKLIRINPKSKTTHYSGRCGPWGTPSNHCRRDYYYSISPEFICKNHNEGKSPFELTVTLSKDEIEDEFHFETAGDDAYHRAERICDKLNMMAHLLSSNFNGIDTYKYNYVCKSY